ncbi:uncharacterized protein LOC117138359 [Drosophila mauritiana]|uniref:Uncharacterized protein LOC117138359 n=1 Tax=Drosophila mauritiana TaxID=7226 RepID=A0A6P8JJ34_DROMA|nr:uncharacterized protein LOC117138359 [Drosophila mauritiana]
MSESASAGGEDTESEGVAAVPVPDTTPRDADATTSGARMMMQHPLLAAAAVAVYATRVMWVKLRVLRLAKQLRLQKQRFRMSNPRQDNESGSEAESDTDGMEGDSDVNRIRIQATDNDRLVGVPQ